MSGVRGNGADHMDVWRGVGMEASVEVALESDGATGVATASGSIDVVDSGAHRVLTGR